MKIRFVASVALGAAAAVCAAQDSVPKKALAEIDGKMVFESDLIPLIGPQLRQLYGQEYDLQKRALEEAINQKVLEAEAGRRGLAMEKLVEQDADSKVAAPTPAEVEAFYLGQKDRLNRPLDDIRPQLQQALMQARIAQARQGLVKRLREKAQVTILLRPPKIEVSYDPKRLSGDAKAPVMIVEFSDFQCPFCRNAQSTLKEVRQKYKDRVRLAYRDFPLRDIHPQAQSAAEATRCAGEQGKFWEYRNLLFGNPAKQDRPGLTKHARSLQLEQRQFEDCLASGKYKGKVEEDLQAGTRAGVSGTPGFFVNGIFLNGAVPFAEFEKVIDAELAALERRGSSSR